MFAVWNLWRALFSSNTHFEIRPFALLPTNFVLLHLGIQSFQHIYLYIYIYISK